VYLKNLSTEVPACCGMTSLVTLTGSIVPFGSLPLFSCSSSSRCIRIWRACVSLKRMEIIPLRLRLVKRFSVSFWKLQKLETAKQVWHSADLLTPILPFSSSGTIARKHRNFCGYVCG